VVELVKNGRWVKGDLRWTVVHQGWIFRFSGPAQRQQFLANPEAFAPVGSGNDPVLATDENRSVPGETAYCALYNGRLYMFSSAATQTQFNERPQRYVAAGK
jgi:YHS domain-containing protein